MKQLFSIAALCLMVSACHPLHVVSSTTATQDTTTQQARQGAIKADSDYHQVVKTDTAIGLKGRYASIHFNPVQLLPATDAQGNKVSREYHANDNNLHADVQVNSDGSVDVDCKSDSLTLVITNLIRETTYEQHRFDSLNFLYCMTKAIHTETTVVEEKKHGFWAWLLNLWTKIKDVFAWIGLATVVIVIVKYGKKLLKYWIV